MIVVALCSLVIYGIVAAGRQTGPRAPAFLLVPLASFLVMAVVDRLVD
jgi:hypothetical protein